MLVVLSMKTVLAVGPWRDCLNIITGDRNAAWLYFAQVQKRNLDEAPLKLAIWMQNAQAVINLFFGHGFLTYIL